MVTVLEIDDVSVHFDVQDGVIRALDGVSLTVEAGETLAVVGESGCGKTTLAKVILGLQPIAGGSVILNGREVKGPGRQNAKNVGMVWQDPFASLDPRWTVAKSILEPLNLSGSKGAVLEILEEVGLDGTFAQQYPHQMSGGQRQRVAIGRALALRPPLVVCDEPTAALDLSIRAQILNLLKDLQKSAGCSYLYISHDLTTVRFLADRIAVMYLGRIVELGSAAEVFDSPRHPYTKALLDSAPSIQRLMQLPEALPGEIPDPRTVQIGCKFMGRCPYRQEVCGSKEPELTVGANAEIGSSKFRCYFPLNR